MASIGKVKHAPEGSIGVGLRNLKEREVWGIWGREGKLVNRGNNPRVSDGPLEIAGSLAADDTCGRGGGVARIRGRGLARILTRGKQLGDAEVTLGGGGQEVVLRVLWEDEKEE